MATRSTRQEPGLHGFFRRTARVNSGAPEVPYRAVKLIHYLANLSKGRLILWCYFIWYLVVLVRYFDPSPRLWLTSLGLSAIIGFALFVSTTAAGGRKVELDRWQTIRLFMMPFCVSSFSALVKGKGFVLFFSPEPAEILVAVALCLSLCGTVAVLKRRQNSAVPGKRRRRDGGQPLAEVRMTHDRSDPNSGT
jgi:hypothetical protein